MGRLRDNPAAWDPAFLDCDYIGAAWHWHDDGMRVGNGGFSLRSRRLLDALQDPRIGLGGAEDETICRTFRPLLEREYGIRFADEPLADRFSFEAAYPVGKPFGFHGLFNFCRVVPPAELAALPAAFSDAIARSPQITALLRNCLALGQWSPASAIAARIARGRSRRRGGARAARRRRAAGAARGPATGRNDPCPCGSGKRYKHCHGAPAARADGRGGHAGSGSPRRPHRMPSSRARWTRISAATSTRRRPTTVPRLPSRPSIRMRCTTSASSCISAATSPTRCRCSNAPSR